MTRSVFNRLMANIGQSLAKTYNPTKTEKFSPQYEWSDFPGYWEE